MWGQQTPGYSYLGEVRAVSHQIDFLAMTKPDQFVTLTIPDVNDCIIIVAYMATFV